MENKDNVDWKNVPWHMAKEGDKISFTVHNIEDERNVGYIKEDAKMHGVTAIPTFMNDVVTFHIFAVKRASGSIEEKIINVIEKNKEASKSEIIKATSSARAYERDSAIQRLVDNGSIASYKQQPAKGRGRPTIIYKLI